ncbi:MAG: hypothetical protein AAF901_08195, partial [Bacteroidota bacterium]
RDYEKLPYRRGTLFAFFIDHKIQQSTNQKQSLDDVILKIKNDAITKDQLITHPYFIETISEYLGDDFRDLFQKHIEEGKLLDLETIFIEFGYEYNTEVEVFDLGFQFSEDGKSIASIDKNSEAYKAGLRANDRITMRSIYNGSTEHKAEFKVLRDGEEVPIAYYPIKLAKIAQLKVNDHNKKILNL